MKTMKICLSIGEMDPAFQKMYDMLSEVAEVTVVGLNDFSLKGYDLFIGKKMTAEILAEADRLKAIFAYKTGVDDFPLALLQQRNILVVNSHIDSHIIAEYAFGLSISLVNRITESDRKLRQDIWYDAKNPYWKSFFEMKVGLLGYGYIGQDIHKLLKQNHIETYTIDRGKKYEDILTVQTLEELCDCCDLVITSLPKTEETDNIINQHILKHLKGKYLVNVGRSNAIDQKALYEALESGYLSGAAIDTWDQKPKKMTDLFSPSKYPFVNLDNIVLSPHQAMRVEVGHERYVMDITDKVITYITKSETRDVVDLSKGY